MPVPDRAVPDRLIGHAPLPAAGRQVTEASFGGIEEASRSPEKAPSESVVASAIGPPAPSSLWAPGLPASSPPVEGPAPKLPLLDPVSDGLVAPAGCGLAPALPGRSPQADVRKRSHG